MPHRTEWQQSSADIGPASDDSSNKSSPLSTPIADSNIHSTGSCPCKVADNSTLGHFRRRQSQQTVLAKKAMASSSPPTDDLLLQHKQSNESVPDHRDFAELRADLDRTLSPADRPSQSLTRNASMTKAQPVPNKSGSLAAALKGNLRQPSGASAANNDTPTTTADNSPRMRGDYLPHVASSEGGSPPMSIGLPMRERSGTATSGTSTPRPRPTTLDIPGLTKSKVSPDGRIAQRDVGAKLVIVMVGLPARGKSYITKKLARYLNWLQHDTRIFNVGARRRLVGGGPNSLEKTRSQLATEDAHEEAGSHNGEHSRHDSHELPHQQPVTAAQILLNGHTELKPPATPPRGSMDVPGTAHPEDKDHMDHDAAFFDPANKKGSQIREQVARQTLDELLDYILHHGGSVGILDATNSTMDRRKMIMDRIRERAGPELNVLFLESSCVDQELLEANMRLKLKGPDYRGMDPVAALADFRKRVQVYEKAYVPLGDYEEKNHMPYIQMIDVGRKIISHQIRGFLMAQANYYLLNFNLAPRQIWITRHGLSEDNISGKIGGDSDLAPEGHQYAKSLTRFIELKRREWDIKQVQAQKHTHFPPQPGDATPPNPHFQPPSPRLERSLQLQRAKDSEASIGELAEAMGYEPKSFCVWTSMLKRSIQTAQYFNDEEYDTKQMRMLDELNAGVMEGLTYSCISTQFPDEYKSRRKDKLHYRYPGPGGEGYLDIINRLRPVIVELERMTDHVLLVGHRSVARVLLAYFRGLDREEVADLDVPLGMLYCLEPKPYGVDFKVYKWDRETQWFYEQPDFQLKRAEDDMQ